MIIKVSNYGKMIVICCCLIASSIGICINSSGIFYSSISKSLDLQQGSVSFSGTLLMLSSAIMSLFIPKIMEKICLKKLLVITSFIAFLCTIIIPLIPTTEILYICSWMRGIAIAFFSAVPITMVMNNWFHKHYGIFTSIVFGCSGITSAIVSPILLSIINVYGWQFAYICMAIIQLFLCLPALLCKFTLTPGEQNMIPYGASFKVREEFVKSSKKSDKHIKLKLIAIILFASFTTAIAGVCQHFTSISIQADMPYVVTAFIMTAVMIGNITFKFLIGMLSDKIGSFDSCLLMIMINIIASLCMMFSSVPVLYLAGSYLFGAIYSVSAVGNIILIKELFGVKLYNTFYPIVSFFSNIAMALSIVLIGIFYDYMGTYSGVFYIVILLQVYNIIFLYWCKLRTFRIYKQKMCKNHILESQILKSDS